MLNVARSKEEIDRQVWYAEKFVKKNPVNFFGDDNKEDLRIFKSLVTKATEENWSENKLYDYADGYDDEHQALHATGVIEWLFGLEYDPPYALDEDIKAEMAEDKKKQI